jgi:hypothetical protein
MSTKAYILTYFRLLSLNLIKTSVMLANEGLAEALNAKKGDLHLFFACSYILGATACSHLNHLLNLLVSTSLNSSVFLLTFWLSCLKPASTFIPLSFCFFAALGTSLLAWVYGHLKGKRKYQLTIISICLVPTIVLLLL